MLTFSVIFLQAERDRQIKEEQQMQEEAIALELEKAKLEELRDEKMRQQVRETRYESKLCKDEYFYYIIHVTSICIFMF